MSTKDEKGDDRLIERSGEKEQKEETESENEVYVPELLIVELRLSKTLKDYCQSFLQSSQQATGVALGLKALHYEGHCIKALIHTG